jgi:putative flippase GtrA
MRDFVHQFVAFAGVGALAAVGHYGTLVIAVEALAVRPVPASLLGFVVGGVISYLLNRRYTFRSRRAHAAAVPRFFTVATVGFVLNGLAMAVLTGPLAVHYLAAQVVTTGVVLCWTFLANRTWTFRPAKAAAPAAPHAAGGGGHDISPLERR